jgi:hypothetical protein
VRPVDEPDVVAVIADDVLEVQVAVHEADFGFDAVIVARDHAQQRREHCADHG